MDQAPPAARAEGQSAEPGGKRLELAARAAWLYYIGNRTQDEIAQQLDVSRAGAQRLVALARAAGLIKFRLDHPVAACAELGERLRARFSLRFCDVAPDGGDALAGVAVYAATRIEAVLAAREPAVLALSSGRMLRAAVQQVSPVDRPQHSVVSLIGNLSRHGRAGPYEVVMRLADLARAQCYPSPLPVVAATAEEGARMREERSYAVLQSLAGQAPVHFVGVGSMDAAAPLHLDGFISGEELAEMVAAGAVGEICGWAYDSAGRVLRLGTNLRLTALSLDAGPVRAGIAAGARKVRPLAAALRAGLLTALVTDEATARALLAA